MEVENADPFDAVIEAEGAELGPGEGYLAFRVAEEEYCIQIDAVREIRRWTPATKLPHAPNHVAGVINIRGEVLPVLDFAARTGQSATKPSERHTIIVLNCLDQIIGLLVEAVSDIVRIPDGALEPTPDIASPAVQEVVSGIAVVDERMLRVLYVESLSPKAEEAA